MGADGGGCRGLDTWMLFTERSVYEPLYVLTLAACLKLAVDTVRSFISSVCLLLSWLGMIAFCSWLASLHFVYKWLAILIYGTVHYT